MKSNQAKLLSSLARKIKSKPRTRAEVVLTLKSAKILTKKENLTSHYSNLEKVIVTSE